MLGSITPLGERGRGSRWGLTVTVFVAAAALGGALLGAVLGFAGALVGLGGTEAAVAVLGAALLIGLALELRLGGVSLPSVDRQVDDHWLYRYRGWVTGAGFGFQLGLGVVTIVTSALTYVAFAAAALSGSALAGAALGALYGLVRGATVLGAAKVDAPDRVIGVDAWLRRWERPARRGAVALQTTLLVLAVAVLVG